MQEEEGEQGSPAPRTEREHETVFPDLERPEDAVIATVLALSALGGFVIWGDAPATVLADDAVIWGG